MRTHLRSNFTLRLRSVRLTRAHAHLFCGTHGQRSLTSEANSNVDAWMKQMRRLRVLEKDSIDPQRAQQLLYTLPTRENELNSRLQESSGPYSLQSGDLFPLGHHLILFPPVSPLDKLNADGTDPTYNAPPPYTRRMWAGGEFAFNSRNPLRIGHSVTCETKVRKVELKGTINPMIFVHQSKEFSNASGLSISEIRTHVFLQPPEHGKHAVRAAPVPTEQSRADFSFTCIPSPAVLFRFSALTFNAHAIHLDSLFSQNVDGHPDRLVHGPLTALMLLELASHNLPVGGDISRFSYRARNPVVVNRPLHLKGTWNAENGNGKFWAEDDNSLVCMTADASLE